MKKFCLCPLFIGASFLQQTQKGEEMDQKGLCPLFIGASFLRVHYNIIGGYGDEKVSVPSSSGLPSFGQKLRQNKERLLSLSPLHRGFLPSRSKEDLTCLKVLCLCPLFIGASFLQDLA